MNDTSSKLDFFAGQLDGLELAHGGTVTQVHLDAIKAVSDGLKELSAGSPPPKAPEVRDSYAPVVKSTTSRPPTSKG